MKKITLAFLIFLSHFTFAHCEWVNQLLPSNEIAKLLKKSPGKKHEIGIFGDLRIDEPDSCSTAGITTCTGIAIINLKTKVAYLGHFPGQNVGTANAFINRALKEAKSPKDLQVFMVGNQVMADWRDSDYSVALQQAKNYAKYLREELSQGKIPPDQITDLLRLEPRGVVYDLGVDTHSKTIFYTETNPVQN